MIDKLKLYISAAPDLRLERDALARAVAEIPTSLGFTITQTPASDREPDLDAVVEAHLHLLMIGSDIQAPVGLEWATARRNGKPVTLLYKSSALHTQAAHAFMRDLTKMGTWRAFGDTTQLRRQVLRLIVDHLLTQRVRYEIGEDEAATLRDWRKALDDTQKRETGDVPSGADESAVILTTERFVPSGGKLLRGSP